MFEHSTLLKRYRKAAQYFLDSILDKAKLDANKDVYGSSPLSYSLYSVDTGETKRSLLPPLLEAYARIIATHPESDKARWQGLLEESNRAKKRF